MTARASQAELARLLGVSRQAVNQLVHRGVLELGQDNRIDVELARVALANRTHPSSKTAQAVAATPPPALAAPNTATPASPPAAAPPSASSDEASVTSYHVAKTLREAAEARMAQLKLAELRGDLVRRDDIRAALSRRVATFRDALMQLPARLSTQLAAESNAAAVHALLEAELRNAVAHLSENAMDIRPA